MADYDDGSGWVIFNADSGLDVSLSHPYSDTGVTPKPMSQGKAEAFAVVLGGDQTRCTPGHEGEAKLQVREVE